MTADPRDSGDGGKWRQSKEHNLGKRKAFTETHGQRLFFATTVAVDITEVIDDQ